MDDNKRFDREGFNALKHEINNFFNETTYTRKKELLSSLKKLKKGIPLSISIILILWSIFMTIWRGLALKEESAWYYGGSIILFVYLGIFFINHMVNYKIQFLKIKKDYDFLVKKLEVAIKEEEDAVYNALDKKLCEVLANNVSYTLIEKYQVPADMAAKISESVRKNLERFRFRDPIEKVSKYDTSKSQI